VRACEAGETARKNAGEIAVPVLLVSAGADTVVTQILNEKRVGPLLRKGRKSRFDLAACTGLVDRKLQPHSAGGSLHIPHRSFSIGSVGRVDEQGNVRCSGDQRKQEFQPLGPELDIEDIDAGQVAARPGEARHETKLHRVVADDKDDRDPVIGYLSNGPEWSSWRLSPRGHWEGDLMRGGFSRYCPRSHALRRCRLEWFAREPPSRSGELRTTRSLPSVPGNVK
jgi:hypothetical protein